MATNTENSTNKTINVVLCILFLLLTACGGGGEEDMAMDIAPMYATPGTLAFADKAEAGPGTYVKSNSIIVPGDNTSSAISIVGGEYSIDGGPFTNAPGIVNSGQSVRVRHTAAANLGSTTETILTIGDISITHSSVTVEPDTTPAPFRFVNKTDVVPDKMVESEPVTILGINTSVPISVERGEYSIDGGAYTDAIGLVNIGQTVRLRHKASSQYAARQTTSLTIGSTVKSFASVTIATPLPDTTPDAFTFEDQTSVKRSQYVYSNPITISGINERTPISVVNGYYQLGEGGKFENSDGFVTNNTQIRVRHRSTDIFGDRATTVLTVGNVRGIFTSTTVERDTIPEAFSLKDRNNIAISTRVESNAILVSGINVETDISITGGEYAINRGGYTNVAGTVKAGQSVRVRHYSAGNLNSDTETTLTIGGVSDTFRSTTIGTMIKPMGYGEYGVAFDLNAIRIEWRDDHPRSHYRLLEDPDGHSGYSYITDINADKRLYFHPMSSHASGRARYILEACGDDGCVSSKAITRYYFDNSLYDARSTVRVSREKFHRNNSPGKGISISGDGKTLAIATIYDNSAATGINGDESSTSRRESGAVYIYKRANDRVGGSIWVQEAYIKASNTGSYDWFGTSISLSDDGNLLAVGAHGEGSEATGINQDQYIDLKTNSGAVYTFSRRYDSSGSAIWSQEAYIKASNSDTWDLFGRWLNLSGDGTTLAVHAPGEDSAATGINGDQSSNANSSTGAVYVFTRQVDSSGLATWIQEAYMKASESGHKFGEFLSLSNDGNTLAAKEHNKVSVFSRSRDVMGSVTWVKQASIEGANTSLGDEFGHNIILSGDGNILAVGAPGEDSVATGINNIQQALSDDLVNSGAAYVFTRSFDAFGVASWNQEAYIKPPKGKSKKWAGFGYYMGFSGDGNILVIGGKKDQRSRVSKLIVDMHTYKRRGGVWRMRSYIPADNLYTQKQQHMSLTEDGYIAVPANYDYFRVDVM